MFARQKRAGVLREVRICGKKIQMEAPAMCSVNPFDIASLESEALTKLFNETTSYIQSIRIEVVANRGSHRNRGEHPATTIGLTLQKPTVQFVDSLDKGQRIEAISHEFVHLLLVYRYGLGVIGRKIPRYGDRDDVFRYFMSMGGNWAYLLGQAANTAHHLILADYLKEKYGIQSNLHLHLLHHNFRIIANENSQDKESLYARGLIAFEYEKLIGKIDRVINTSRETESFWEAYHSARKHFGRYSFHSIPTPSSYEEDILSFLEDLGYQRQDFMFFPEGKRNFCSNT
jgi:hypothetical protein